MKTLSAMEKKREIIQEILEGEKNEVQEKVSFDEAMKRAKFGKFQISLIILAGLFMGSVFYETMGITYVLPVAECDLKITSKTQYGLISGVWFTGIILTSHTWGFLGDTYGRKYALIIASLSAFVTTVLSSFVTSVWQLILFRFLNGLCISGSTSIIFAYLGEFLGAKNRSRSMMMASVIFGMTCLSLPLVSWMIISKNWSFVIPLINVTYEPWRLFLACCGLPSLVCGISMIFYPESPKFTFSQANEAETLKIMAQIYFVNTGDKNFPVISLSPNDEFDDAKAENEKEKGKSFIRKMITQTRDLFKLYPRSIILLSAIQFGIYFVSNGMLLFFPDILDQTADFIKNNSTNGENVHLCAIVENAIKDKREHSEINCEDDLDETTFYYAMMLEVCYVVGFLIISWLVNYTGRLAIFSFIFFSTSFCGFVLDYMNTTLGSYLYVWLLASGINNTLLNTVTYDLFPTNLRSLAMSLTLMFGRLGALVGGNIAGYLLEEYCETTFALSGAVMLACGVLTFCIPNITKKK